jgi:hypothetical protein
MRQTNSHARLRHPTPWKSGLVPAWVLKVSPYFQSNPIARMAVDENAPNEAIGKRWGLRGLLIDSRNAPNETETIAQNHRNTMAIHDSRWHSMTHHDIQSKKAAASGSAQKLLSERDLD